MNLEAPVLVGGTGRSGSTIVGHLLDQHPDLVLTRPMEVRFITGNNGVADALAIAERGKGDAQAAAALAADRILNRWYRRAPNVGLHTSITEEQINTWTTDYLNEFTTAPRDATRRLTNRIMEAIAVNLGATRLVDTTPANARKADRVAPIYPAASIIVVLRDGRDVAASFVSQSFGPDDVFEALDQWEQRMLRSHRAAQRSDRVLMIELADLVERDRAGTLNSVLDFIGVADDADMRAWFDANVNPAQAHGGRWRTDFDPRTADEIDTRYAVICDRLSAEGVRIPT